MPGDVIILHKRTKNDDSTLCCSWDMVCDGCNCYFSFWAIFCPFTPLTTRKIKISKKLKKAWKYHHFTQDLIVIFHFRLFFALLSLNSPKNENFKKMKKAKI